MYQTLVAEEAGQLDFPHPEAKPTMGVSMDETVRGWGGVVVADRSHRPQVIARKVSVSFERLVGRVHHTLKSRRNPLGFCGAEAIYNELAELGIRPMPCVGPFIGFWCGASF